MAYTPRYRRTLELRNGNEVHVRPIQADDEPRLHEAFARMSERSVYFRFLSPLKRLPEELARRLAKVDHHNRLALVATTYRPDGHEHILGVARYDRVSGTDVAEVAVAVVDEVQRQGLGSALLGLLAQAAREHGIQTFVLMVLPDNQSMMGLLRKLGWIHQVRLNGSVYEITFDLP
ncbi:MAG TPA: GNAT family N-acetyltransferase [Candidatus Dormibacteraeota bacterium]|nr:GNAT family N-acetyltransferase [Candidatus Dormibacteraeota bacterium]